MQKINEEEGSRYEYIRSERLGRSTSKETCAYLYNSPGSFDVTLVGIHTRPDDAYSEIGNLSNVVYLVLSENPDEKDIIVMGDFNADGRYFDENDVSNPFKVSGFYWVISNDMHTMTKTDYTYDRIVLMNATYSHEYIEASAAVFRFDREYGVGNETLVWEVSDHYPVYAEFRTDLIDDD